MSARVPRSRTTPPVNVEPLVMPTFAQALFLYLISEIERVYWNRYQQIWNQHDDPRIPGLTWSPYYWGDDKILSQLPNFAFGKVTIWWYKHPSRGLTTNVTLPASQWRQWFDRCLTAIIATDRGLPKSSGSGPPRPRARR